MKKQKRICCGNINGQEYHLKKLIDKIKKEAQSRTCMSYDYDPTPSGEDRLNKILGMLEEFEKGNKNCNKQEPNGTMTCYKKKNHSGSHDWGRDELG